MVDIGLLGLDTSHADAFAQILAEDEEASVAAVWDGGDVRNAEYARRFVARREATLYEDPVSMVDHVDAVMVLTVDWDRHVPLAKPFLEADVPTLIDKPLAGRLADLEALSRASEGTPLFGGSAVPYHPDLADLTASRSADALYCVGCNHPFYYGAHIIDVVRAVAGREWHSVAPADDPGATVDVVFADDSFATVRLDGPTRGDDGDRYVLLSTDQARSVELTFGDGELDHIYEAYVDEFLETVRGEADVPDRVLDGGRLLLAAHAALDRGQVVTRDSEELANYHVDGGSYLEEYRS